MNTIDPVYPFSVKGGDGSERQYFGMSYYDFVLATVAAALISKQPHYGHVKATDLAEKVADEIIKRREVRHRATFPQRHSNA